MALTPELEALFFKKFCHSLPYGVYPDEEESDKLVLFVLDEFPVEVQWRSFSLYEDSKAPADRRVVGHQ